VVVAFRQGARDEKMLKKLATHDIQDVFALFSLTNKCTKAAEGRAWHSPVAQEAKGESKPNVGTQAQGGGSGNGNNNNKKKKADDKQPLAGAPTAAAAIAGGGQEATNAPGSCPIATTRPRQLSNSYDSDTKCPVYNSTCHSASECREIKKLMEQFHKKM
jgi:hypothetical protein